MRYSVQLFLLALSVVLGCQGREERPAVEGDPASDDATGLPTVSANLPTGQSPLTKIEATVTGTVTEYKFYFSSSHPLGYDCANATYGDFRSISTKLTISEAELGADSVTGSAKTVCIVGRSGTDTESQPKPYQWMKITSATAELPAEKLPKVTVPDIESSYNDASIELTITAENGATHYQYALKQGELDCEDDFDAEEDYGDDREVGADEGKLTLTLEALGDYTLCVRGKNGAKLQQDVSEYKFEKVVDPDSQEESAGMLAVTTSHKPRRIYLASATKGTPKITLSNEGNSNLEWRIEAERAASWLKIGTDKSSLSTVSADDDLINGTLSAGQETTVYLKLADVYKTDYEAGKKRVTLKVHDVSGSDAPVSIDVNMVVPEVKMSISPIKPPNTAVMTLSASQPKGKVMLDNAKGGNWAVKYQFKPLISGAYLSKFNDIISYREHKPTDSKQPKYIEFSVDQAKLASKPAGYTASMWYCIVTNTSSKGTVPPTSICKDDRKLQGGATTTLATGITFTPDYTTNVCEVFVVLVTK